MARKFRNIFRYIDDLLAINDGNEFENHHKDIYPAELELKKENALNTSTNFLEVNIKIHNQIFEHKLFDKRDGFGFHINRLPFKNSNIPINIFYNTITAEILPICRASSLAEYAVDSTNSIILRMCQQGANINIIKQRTLKCLNRHASDTNKFGKTPREFIDLLN